jgi:acetyltransferase-like isoleucine patch superfamily enzyme
MNFLRRYISSLKKTIKHRLYLYLKKTIEFGDNIERHQSFYQRSNMHSSVKVLANATIENPSGNPQLINIGENSVIGGQLFLFAHAGKIDIGKDCYIGEGTRIWSADSIKIGNRVFISHNVNVHDTNSHSIDPVPRYQHFLAIMSTGHPNINDFDIQSDPICIEDDVWIGFNSTILKGVKIGKGAIVAACSVVTRDIPSFVIVAGNPAQVVKEIKAQRENK